jgi:hypothetical protein
MDQQVKDTRTDQTKTSGKPRKRQKAAAAARQKRYRVLRDLGFRVAPFTYNAEILTMFVEQGAISSAVADSGNSRLFGEALSAWALRAARK